MLIDTHAHIMFPEFDEDREAVIQRARDAGLKAIINVGCGAGPSAKSVEMADGEFLYATVGLHPYDALDLSDELMGEWEKLIVEDSQDSTRLRRVVAIGETGLDYFKGTVDPEKQKESFRAHLELAKKTALPIIVHNRSADEDSLELLLQFLEVKAVFHCYGSSLDFARRVWAAGYFTSFTGIITYPNAADLREVVKEAPLDQFMVETDCPYLAPQAYRGKRNEPAYVTEVAKMIAEVKGLSYEEVVALATANTEKFFSLN